MLEICCIDGCDKKKKALQMCSMHYWRYSKHGDPLVTKRDYGKGRRITSAGYVEVWAPEHPLAMSHGYVLEHRKVMHDLGFDVKGMEVHHKDENRQNNHPDNLEIIKPGLHQSLHGQSGASNQFGHFESVKNKICDVENCDKPVKSRKWCTAHYTRYIRYGNPLATKNSLLNS
jgi:hypothetical protein